jgi:hypothetical protein
VGVEKEALDTVGSSTVGIKHRKALNFSIAALLYEYGACDRFITI